MYCLGSLSMNERRLAAMCSHQVTERLFFSRPAAITIARGKPSHFLFITFPGSSNPMGHIPILNTFFSNMAQLSSSLRRRKT
ncbi:hypothetical protein HanHA300_Chr12g0439691 [Helianthus annuus]|nr:hypothetical protein HanHA300_Chr12g0439691 [Helianthus annuus]KAJ0504936.1 hypothetical protein HanHA89_Chr12g0464811 [Helianthus annuus]KAJ0674626.1 hypothetical protein HanLR1_Chr12g0442001 [Helianthus annuus]